MGFRDSEEKRLKEDPNLELGDVTTVNMTMMKVCLQIDLFDYKIIMLTFLQGGVQWNVVPSELCVSFDIRVPPTLDLEKFDAQLVQWVKDAGEDITFEWHQKVSSLFKFLLYLKFHSYRQWDKALLALKMEKAFGGIHFPNLAKKSMNLSFLF